MTNKYLDQMKKEKQLREVKDDIDLSIVVPVYNAQSVILTCLKSIFSQITTYNYEVIFVNDGSSDNSVKIINQFIENNQWRLAKVIDQKNEGISSARNKGITESQGTYIGFIDNDDFIEENYVQKLMDLAKNRNIEIVKCGFSYYDLNKGTVLNISSFPEFHCSSGLKENLLLVPSYIWAGIYKRELFESVRFPRGYWYEDMIGRLVLNRLAKSFAMIELPLYNHTIHSSKASLTLWNQNDEKSLDQVFLPIELFLYGKEVLGLSTDVFTIQALIWELGPMLVSRTKKLEYSKKKKALKSASNFMNQSNFSELKRSLSIRERTVFNSILNNNFATWFFFSVLYLKMGKKKLDISND